MPGVERRLRAGPRRLGLGQKAARLGAAGCSSLPAAAGLVHLGDPAPAACVARRGCASLPTPAAIAASGAVKGGGNVPECSALGGQRVAGAGTGAQVGGGDQPALHHRRRRRRHAEGREHFRPARNRPGLGGAGGGMPRRGLLLPGGDECQRGLGRLGAADAAGNGEGGIGQPVGLPD